MARATKKRLERRLSALRERPAPAETRIYVDKCQAWLKTKKDGRGTAVKAIQSAFYSTVWFDQALAARSHDNSSIRRHAGKAVTAVRHESFPEIQNRLRTLSARVSTVGKRAAEERRRASERTIELDDQFILRELRTAKSVQCVGRALGNCVAKASYAKDYLRDADTEMWTLIDRATQSPLHLMRIDRSMNVIDEFEGVDGPAPRLECVVALRILRALAVTADDEEAFCSVGAFRSFLDGQPDVDPIDIDGCLYWVWLLSGGTEVIIATETRFSKHMRWSRFLRHGSETVIRRKRRRRQEFVGGCWNHLSEGELLALAVDHPSFAERLRDGEFGRESGKGRAA